MDIKVKISEKIERKIVEVFVCPGCSVPLDQGWGVWYLELNSFWCMLRYEMDGKMIYQQGCDFMEVNATGSMLY